MHQTTKQWLAMLYGETRGCSFNVPRFSADALVSSSMRRGYVQRAKPATHAAWWVCCDGLSCPALFLTPLHKHLEPTQHKRHEATQQQQKHFGATLHPCFEATHKCRVANSLVSCQEPSSSGEPGSEIRDMHRLSLPRLRAREGIFLCPRHVRFSRCRLLALTCLFERLPASGCPLLLFRAFLFKSFCSPFAVLV